MKKGNKFLNFFKLNENTDEILDDGTTQDNEDQDFYDELEDDLEELEDDTEEKKSIFSFNKHKKDAGEDEVDDLEDASSDRVVSIRRVDNKEEGEIVKVIRPQVFNEAELVASYLKEGKTIVVNLEGIEIGIAQRIIDFIGGASYAVDGTINAISNNIFIVAPGNIEVSGDLKEEVINKKTISPELSNF